MNENLDKIKLRWVNFIFTLDFPTLEDVPECILNIANAHEEKSMVNALIYDGLQRGKPTGSITRVLKVSRKRIKRIRDNF
jgi:hypothetical protein